MEVVISVPLIAKQDLCNSNWSRGLQQKVNPVVYRNITYIAKSVTKPLDRIDFCCNGKMQ